MVEPPNLNLLAAGYLNCHSQHHNPARVPGAPHNIPTHKQHAEMSDGSGPLPREEELIMKALDLEGVEHFAVKVGSR